MIRGIHHFGLTVRDVDASAVWYQEVLEFRRLRVTWDPAIAAGSTRCRNAA